MVRFADVKQLARHVRRYYEANGAQRTLLAVLRRLGSPQLLRPRVLYAQMTRAVGPAASITAEFVVPYDPSRIKPIGPSAGSFVQEITLSMEVINNFEILLSILGRPNTGTAELSLVSDRGRLLYIERIALGALNENGYYALTINGGLDLCHSQRLFLVVRVQDGSAESNGISVFRTDQSTQCLYFVPGDVLEPGRLNAAWLADSGNALDGSLVFRIQGSRKASIFRYPQPPFPAHWSATRVCTNEVAFVSDKSATELPAIFLDLCTARRMTAAELLRRDDDLFPRFIVFRAVRMTDLVRQLMMRARSACTPIAYLCDTEIHPDIVLDEEVNARKESGARAQQRELFATFKACDFAICTSEDVAEWARRNGKTGPVLERYVEAQSDASRCDTSVISEIVSAYRRRRLPKISVVTILHGKAEQIDTVLTSYFRQSYEGDFEIVFVDDQYPDQSIEAVGRCFDTARRSGKYQRLPEYVVLRNEQNLGNCMSRNRGIRAAKGDIVIVLDVDCMVNRDFLKRHAEAHSSNDCDIVIGPMNLETNGRDPFAVLDEYEERIDRVLADAQLQDPINPRSFLNCITRNVSIKAAFLTEELFDPLFSYSRDPDSGYGWEDVEMGYTLYKRGARVKYASDAFTVHISHPSSVDDGTKPLRSLRNFRRLFEKHPELIHVGRRWAIDTLGKICAWSDSRKLPLNDDRRFLEDAFRSFRPLRAHSGNQRRLRILTYRWHVPHQYELYKLPHDFTLVTDLGTNMTTEWELRQRPLPVNAQFRRIDQIDPNQYDLAILHFDEVVLTPEMTNGVIGSDWGKTFKWFQENVHIPKVAICHGTPPFYGQYDINYSAENLMQPIEQERERLVEFLGDTLVILNSYQAQREWSFHRSKVIWHGFDPAEFPPTTFEKGILSPFGPLVLSRPHYRGFFVYERVFKGLPPEFKPATLHVPEPDISYEGNEYAVGRFQNYVNELRRHSVYFNPTLRSPMPRARGEAMLCGLVTVSAKNHDVEHFIENGENGFFSGDADELRDFLVFLMRNRNTMRKIGMRGRLTAMDIFNHDRYLREWEETIAGLGVDSR